MALFDVWTNASDAPHESNAVKIQHSAVFANQLTDEQGGAMLIFNSSKALVRLYPDVRRLTGEVGESPTLSRNGKGACS